MEFKTCFSCVGAPFFSVRKTHGNCILDAEMEGYIHHRPSPPADVVRRRRAWRQQAEMRRLNDPFNLSRERVVVGQADTCTNGYEANLCWHFLEYWALPSTNDSSLGNSCRQICGRYGTNETNPDKISGLAVGLHEFTNQTCVDFLLSKITELVKTLKLNSVAVRPEGLWRGFTWSFERLLDLYENH